MVRPCVQLNPEPPTPIPMTRFSLEILESFMLETPPEFLGKWLLVSRACHQRARIYVFADINIICPHSRAAPYFTKRITRFLNLLTPKDDPQISILPLVKRFVCRPFTKTIPKNAVEPLGRVITLLAGGEVNSPFGTSALEEFTFAGSYSSHFFFTDFHQSIRDGLCLMAQKQGLKVFKIHRIQRLPPSFFSKTSCEDVVLIMHYPATNADGAAPVQKEDSEGTLITRITSDFSYPFSNRTFKGLRSVSFVTPAHGGGAPFEYETMKEMRTAVYDARNSLEEFHFELIGESLGHVTEEIIITRPFERLDPSLLVRLKHLGTTQQLITMPNPLRIDISATAVIFREYGRYFKDDPCPLETVTFKIEVNGDYSWAWYASQIEESKRNDTVESWRLLDRVLSSPPFYDPARRSSANRPPLKIKVFVTRVANTKQGEEQKEWETKTLEALKEVLARMVECHQDNFSIIMNHVESNVPRGWDKY